MDKIAIITIVLSLSAIAFSLALVWNANVGLTIKNKSFTILFKNGDRLDVRDKFSDFREAEKQ
jgi:hypothetical protein